MHFRRLCARPGCGSPATATLRFQPTLRQAWLVDLDESASRTQGDLCRRHAAALVLPRGWELHDQRSDGPRLVQEAPVDTTPPARRVRVRRRPAEREPVEAPDQLPGFEPVVVTGENPEPAEIVAEEAEEEAEEVVDTPVATGVDPEVDAALSSILDARTPLLRRAFRNAKPED